MTARGYAVEAGRADDRAALLELLHRCGLPEAGIGDHLATTLVYRDPGGGLAGCGALEVYGDVALLRSLAVGPNHRGRRLGVRMIEALLDLAARRGVQEVYLLTETAAELFARHGFTPVDRAAVPEAIRRTVEFAEACPESATVMRHRLVTQPSE